MILAEIILLGILVFGMGTYTGLVTKKSTATLITKEVQPDAWEPNNHIKLLKTCALMCGEDNLKDYNSVYGKCSCK